MLNISNRKRLFKLSFFEQINISATNDIPHDLLNTQNLIWTDIGIVNVSKGMSTKDIYNFQQSDTISSTALDKIMTRKTSTLIGALIAQWDDSYNEIFFKIGTKIYKISKEH